MACIAEASRELAMGLIDVLARWMEERIASRRRLREEAEEAAVLRVFDRAGQQTRTQAIVPMDAIITASGLAPSAAVVVVKRLVERGALHENRYGGGYSRYPLPWDRPRA